MQGGLSKQNNSSFIPIDLITSKIQKQEYKESDKNKIKEYEKFYEENFKYIKPGKDFKHFKECNEIFKLFHNNNFFWFHHVKPQTKCRYADEDIKKMNDAYYKSKDIIPILLGNTYFKQLFDDNVINDVIKYYDINNNTKSINEINGYVKTFVDNTNLLFFLTRDSNNYEINTNNFIGLDNIDNTFSPFFKLFENNHHFDIYNRINPSLINTFGRFVCKVETFYELDTPENKDKIMNFVFQYIVNYLLENTIDGYVENDDNIDDCDCFIMFNNMYELYDAYQDIIDYIIKKYIK